MNDLSNKWCRVSSIFILKIRNLKKNKIKIRNLDSYLIPTGKTNFETDQRSKFLENIGRVS